MTDLGTVTNEKFYKAFNSQNLGLMQEVWHMDSSVVCIHPGWIPLRGYETVIESWKNIFQNTDNLEIKLSHLKIISSTGLTWVNCQENLYSITETGVQSSKVHATNLFKQIGNQWKMVLHHASSIPDIMLGNDRNK